MPPAASCDVVPAGAFDLEPEIESLEDLELRLAALSYFRSRNATAQAACDQICRSAKTSLETKLKEKIGGKEVPLKDLAQAHEQAIRDFVAAHPDSVFAEGRKTAEFNHGTLSLKLAPVSVGFLKGENEKSVVETIRRKSKIGKALEGLLAALFRKLPLSSFLRVKFELNKQSLLALYRDQKLDDDDFESLGMRADGGEDVLSIEPAEYRLEPASSRAVR